MSNYIDRINTNLKNGNESFDKGDYSVAIKYYGYAFDVAEQNNDVANREFLRYWYSYCDLKLGNHLLALRNFQLIIEHLPKLKESFKYAYDYHLYYRMAEVYEELGQWLNVRQSLNKALESDYAIENKDREIYVKWYIGDSHRERDEFDEAKQLYDEVKNHFAGNAGELAGLNIDEAKLLLKMGELEETLSLLKQTWETASTNADLSYLRSSTAELLAKSTKLAIIQEREDSAELTTFIVNILGDQLKLAEEQNSFSDRAKWISWLSFFSTITGDTSIFEKAELLAEEAAPVLLRSRTPYSLDDYKNLVRIHLSLGGYYYNQITDPGPHLISFKSLEYYKAADRIIDKATARLSSPSLRAEYHMQFTHVAYRIFGLYQTIYEDFWEDFLYEGLGIVEKYKGFDLFQSLDDSSGRQEYLDKMNELDYKITLQKKYLAIETDSEKRKVMKVGIEEMEDTYYDTENEMVIERRSWISVSDPVKMMTETMNDIYPLIDHFRYGVLYFAMNENTLYVIAFTKNNVERVVVDFDPAKIAKVEALLSYLREKAAEVGSKEDLLQLDKVLKKLSKWISKNIMTPKMVEIMEELEYVTIIPSGFFINFPLEVLQINGEYFGTRFKLTREFNLKFLAKQVQDVTREKRNNKPLDVLTDPGDVIFVSNPNYQESMVLEKSDIEFYIVPNDKISKTEEEHTQRVSTGEETYLASNVWDMDLGKTEVQEIVKEFDNAGAKYLSMIDTEVSKEKLLEYMNNKTKIFHFAGHAIFDEENPQFSKMVLRDSKSLIPLDFVNYSFNMNPLFIFSACESGVSEVKAGDEPFGFLRFAKIVRAQNIIFSLWPVLSKPTTKMMVSFYKYILDGKEVSDALRLARKDVITAIQNNEDRLGFYSDLELLYWSPFSFIGLPFYFYQKEVKE